MTKSDMNAQIAEYLGFEKSTKHPINGKAQWQYPASFPFGAAECPCTTIPDFIQILMDYIRLMDGHRGRGPIDWQEGSAQPKQEKT